MPIRRCELKTVLREADNVDAELAQFRSDAPVREADVASLAKMRGHREVHCNEDAPGPRKTPKYFAVQATLAALSAGTFAQSHKRTDSSENDHNGTITHFLPLSSKEVARAQRSNHFMIVGKEMKRSATTTPMSSAKAARDSGRGARKRRHRIRGSTHNAKIDPDRGHPCLMPDSMEILPTTPPAKQRYALQFW